MHLIQTEENRRCPACGNERSEFFCEARDRLYHTTDQTFTYNRCANCKTLFQTRRPYESEIWKSYPNTYGPHVVKSWQRRMVPVPAVLNRVAQRLANEVVGFSRFQEWSRSVEKRMAQIHEVLDFGCGSGKHLDRARKLGCKTLGVDFSPKALQEAASRGHETLPVSDDLWDALARRRLKFVRMNHVVEHLYDPLFVLGKIYAAMDYGGVLHLSTPNSIGPSALEYKEQWFGLDCPRHIALIPPAQLETMLKQIGFSIVNIVQEPGPKDLVRSWAYRNQDSGNLKKVDVENLAGDGVLNLWFAYAMRNAVRKSGNADRYHVLATK